LVCLLQFKCTGIQLVVLTLLCNQILMISAFNDLSVIQNNNHIGIFNGRKPVGDDKHRSAFHQSIHAALNNGFRSGVNRRSRFVQNHDRRVGNGGACNRKKLTLSLRKIGAVSGNPRVVSVRQSGDKIICTDELGGRYAFFVRGIQFSIPNVFHNRAGKQIGVLQYDAERVA